MKIGLYTLLFLGFSGVLLAQSHFNSSHRLEDGALIIEGLSPSRLGTYLDSVEHNSGLALLGWTQDLDIPLAKLAKIKNDARLISQLKFNLSAYKTSLFLEFNSLALEDSIRLENEDHQKITFAFNREGFIFTPGLNKLRRLQLIDHPPFHNSQLQIRFLSLRPAEEKSAVGFGDAGNCQVNAQCDLVPTFEAAKKATVRILWRNGNLQGWCSGTLVNTANYSFQPYVLSAEHCALANGLASARDFDFWLFYFNYQSPDCTNPANENGLNNQVLAGARLIARSDDDGGQSGSDFLLLTLNKSIPAEFDVRYAGWDRSALPPRRGLCYHHPLGDLKKMSRFSQRAQSSSFGEDAEDTHWQVSWQNSRYGHGTTEGGSSGAALLNAQGLIKGILTGGNSSCSNLTGSDLYGKFSYSWNQNGTDPFRQLAPWLDPLNSQVLSIPSAAPGDSLHKTQKAQIQMYPQPISLGQLHLTGYKLKNTFTLRAYDLQGALLWEQAFSPLAHQEQIIRLPRWSPGFYLFQFEQGAILSTQKVLIL